MFFVQRHTLIVATHKQKLNP